MDRILWWIFYFLTFYAFIPGFVSRVFGFRVFRRGLAKREIALTFDDGPDPEYTPRLLDLLKSYGAKATFFVVGSHAEKNPELIRRMHEEGHTLGIHNYVHRSNWIMSPRTVKRQVRRTSDIIESITGERPVYYRPPWGIVNVFDFAQLRHMQIVLWTSMFGDWKEKVGAENLYRKMREKLAPGQVFLLHDRGDTFGADPGAPAQTIAALERILKDGRELGLRFVGIGELIAVSDRQRAARKAAKPSGPTEAEEASAASASASAGTRAESVRKTGPLKRMVVAAWMVWEKVFHVLFRVRPFGDGSFMNYRLVRYNGRELTLRDGSRLVRGDLVVEMHFDNERMYEIGMKSKSGVHVAIRLIREVERALPDIAREVESLPQAGKIKALYGVSMINRGSEGLGFDTFELPRGMFSALTNVYLKLLMRVIHPDGGKKISEHGGKLEPRIIVMSRAALSFWNGTDSSEEARKAIRRMGSDACSADRPEAAEAAGTSNRSKEAGASSDASELREEIALEPLS
ncbi:hypothetical protein J19TS2_31570 [Cohnella xylanilytica]|uniref:polysaccharide deacetylase family protein n=1 Tax=Cohnella xylanilytica TaxID=557555 RepID=UPI001B1B6B9B|nr:polysaccharide deacetylase family protein [Cohnella xylanilytica]GIO13602.1 hypothetical protein J19TS2_31570 [Cohnella xylanilytica]